MVNSLTPPESEVSEGEIIMNSDQYPDVVMPECPAERVLEGQKALVTGCASGIGKAVAIALGRAGADVVVNYRGGEDHANEVVAEIRKCGSRAFAQQADVSNEEEIRNMYQKMFHEFGTIDNQYSFPALPDWEA
jgi:hypothetical protein